MGGSVDNSFARFCEAVGAAIDKPIVWIRENVVVPNQKESVWYHRHFRRVPTIDQCYTDDVTCQYEANQQFRRDKYVDDEILAILRRRKEDCYMYEGPDSKNRCAQLVEDYENAAENWFIKYGDLGYHRNAKRAYMKQKHRMIWERRHGPVGSGMKPQSEWGDTEAA
ncbi:NADH-ubiquinone oxidoreductase subunit 10 [Trinorchestia longiramus]|nr:NADH-ubiquinone oxidoreductase subunit 10 [Trinorchestia longiramus]